MKSVNQPGITVQHFTTVLELDIIDIFISPDITSNFEALKLAQKNQVKESEDKVCWRGAIASMEQIIVPVQTSTIATAQPSVSLMLTVRSMKTLLPY